MQGLPVIVSAAERPGKKPVPDQPAPDPTALVSCSGLAI